MQLTDINAMLNYVQRCVKIQRIFTAVSAEAETELFALQ